MLGRLVKELIRRVCVPAKHGLRIHRTGWAGMGEGKEVHGCAGRARPGSPDCRATRFERSARIGRTVHTLLDIQSGSWY